MTEKAKTSPQRRDSRRSKGGEADSEQRERFIEAARELGCEENLGRLDEALKRVGRAGPKPASSSARKPKNGKLPR